MNKKNKKILLEAVVAQEKKVTHLQAILTEALTHPVFKSFKQFENELEYQLFEGMRGSPAPTGGSINLGAGGTRSMFGEHGETLRDFSRTLDSAPKVTPENINGFIVDLAPVLGDAEDIVEILKDDKATPEAKRSANILIMKLGNYLAQTLKTVASIQKDMLDTIKQLDTNVVMAGRVATKILDSKNKFTDKLSTAGFSGEKAMKDLSAYKKATEEADEYEQKLKKQSKGLFGRLADKLLGR